MSQFYLTAFSSQSRTESRATHCIWVVIILYSVLGSFQDGSQWSPTPGILALVYPISEYRIHWWFLPVSMDTFIQSCPTLCNPMDYSWPGSSVYGIFQARILEWVAISLSRGSSQSRDWTQVSCTAGRLYHLRLFYHFHFVMECCCTNLNLWLGGSDHT